MFLPSSRSWKAPSGSGRAIIIHQEVRHFTTTVAGNSLAVLIPISRMVLTGGPYMKFAPRAGYND